MSRKKFYYMFDILLWTLIALLPVIAWLVSFLSYKITDDTLAVLPTFSSMLDNFTILDNNFILTCLNEIFGSNSSILPVFTESSAILKYFSYFIVIELIHLFIDFIVFIPRIAHKFMDKFTSGDK